MAIRVLIVEDHDDFREGMSHMLQSTEGFRCVGKYASMEDALHKLPEADVVLLDIRLPGKSGIEGISDVRKKLPKAQVLMLTGVEEDSTIFEAILAGANGYLLKKTPPARLLQAIEDAAAGGTPMTPLVARQAIAMFKRFIPQDRESVSLTPREMEVLGFLVDGLSYNAVGEKLFISVETVRNHVRHIYEKLHVHSKPEAVAKAIRQGLF